MSECPILLLNFRLLMKTGDYQHGLDFLIYFDDWTVRDGRGGSSPQDGQPLPDNCSLGIPEEAMARCLQRRVSAADQPRISPFSPANLAKPESSL